MAIRIHIAKREVDNLSANMKEIAAILQKDITQELKRQGRLLVKDLIMFTPPRKAGQGRKKVEKDINKAVKNIDTDKITNKELKDRMEELTRQRKYETMKQIYRKGKKLPKYDFVKFEEKYHKQERKKGGVTYSVPRSTGKATTDSKKWKKYATKIKGRVGTLKASWLVAADALGYKAPLWISKHRSHAYGVGRYKFYEDESISYIYIRNSEKAQPLLRHVADSALALRRANMLKEFQRELKRSLSKKRPKRK